GAVGQLAFSEVRHHALDGQLLVGQVHHGSPPFNSTAASSISTPCPRGRTSSGLISTLLMPGGSPAASSERRTTAAASDGTSARERSSDAPRRPSIIACAAASEAGARPTATH